MRMAHRHPRSLWRNRQATTIPVHQHPLRHSPSWITNECLQTQFSSSNGYQRFPPSSSPQTNMYLTRSPHRCTLDESTPHRSFWQWVLILQSRILPFPGSPPHLQNTADIPTAEQPAQPEIDPTCNISPQNYNHSIRLSPRPQLHRHGKNTSSSVAFWGPNVTVQKGARLMGRILLESEMPVCLIAIYRRERETYIGQSWG